MQNILSRASKYTLFDSTKEIAYIPLDNEVKRRGKAAIDGVGSRLGKSSGSTVTQGFLLIFTTLSASAPYIGILFISISIIWLFATVSLGKQFKIVNKEKPVKDPYLKKEALQQYLPFMNKNNKEQAVK